MKLPRRMEKEYCLFDKLGLLPLRSNDSIKPELIMYNKQLDRCYRFLDRVELDPELRECLDRKMRKIMPMVERDIKGLE